MLLKVRKISESVCAENVLDRVQCVRPDTSREPIDGLVNCERRTGSGIADSEVRNQNRKREGFVSSSENARPAAGLRLVGSLEKGRAIFWGYGVFIN